MPIDYKVVAFDLDDTLAPSKSPIDPTIGKLLIELLGHVDVLVISGGQFDQFDKQVIQQLPAADALDRLHLMPTCGTQYFKYSHENWKPVYRESLTDEEKTSTIESLTRNAKELGLWEEKTWGPIIEDRDSQITFSALGQSAPVAEKKQWDPTGEKKSALRNAVAAELPELEVRSGGSTSVDVTRRGIDKAYGIQKLEEALHIGHSDILFIGDRLDQDGNDYPVKALGVKTVEVSSWEDTADYLRKLLDNA